jgi:nucleoside-diphosphate-sugar epimerase
MNKQHHSSILVTGAFGQIGSELVPALQKKYGKDHVIALAHKTIPTDFDGIIEQTAVTDTQGLELLVKKYNIGTIYHLVSLLSAKGEQDPELTWNLNMNSLRTILELARQHNLRVFWPSSIAAFGPTTPRIQTPQQTVLAPTTMYGVTKVAGELLCQYYFLKYGVDVRSLRYPGIISWKTPPGGGTTDYAVAIFYEGLLHGSYECFVSKETTLPMMYMDDAIHATLQLMDAPKENIRIRTSYNLAAISFTAEELAQEVQKHIPIHVTYTPDHRQKIADSWPASIDDSSAREDWQWQHEFDLPRMTKEMILKLQEKFRKERN